MARNIKIGTFSHFCCLARTCWNAKYLSIYLFIIFNIANVYWMLEVSPILCVIQLSWNTGNFSCHVATVGHLRNSNSFYSSEEAIAAFKVFLFHGQDTTIVNANDFYIWDCEFNHRKSKYCTGILETQAKALYNVAETKSVINNGEFNATVNIWNNTLGHNKPKNRRLILACFFPTIAEISPLANVVKKLLQKAFNSHFLPLFTTVRSWKVDTCTLSYGRKKKLNTKSWNVFDVKL